MSKLTYNGDLDITIKADFTKEMLNIKNLGSGTITIEQVTLGLPSVSNCYQCSSKDTEVVLMCCECGACAEIKE